MKTNDLFHWTKCLRNQCFKVSISVRPKLYSKVMISSHLSTIGIGIFCHRDIGDTLLKIHWGYFVTEICVLSKSSSPSPPPCHWICLRSEEKESENASRDVSLLGHTGNFSKGYANPRHWATSPGHIVQGHFGKLKYRTLRGSPSRDMMTDEGSG